MSYQTCHYLEIPDEGPDISEVAAMLTEIVSGKSPGDPGHCMYQNTWSLTLEGEPTRWYDSTEHMTKVSKRWTDVLFTLRGEGEDTNDRWVAYYSRIVQVGEM